VFTVPLPADMIKTRLASTAPPIIIDEELKENWSRRPHCSMILDLFLGLRCDGASHIFIVSALGSFGLSWLILCSSTMSGSELRWAVGHWMESGGGVEVDTGSGLALSTKLGWSQ